MAWQSVYCVFAIYEKNKINLGAIVGDDYIISWYRRGGVNQMIEIQNLVKTYGEKLVLDQVSITIPRNKISFLLVKTVLVKPR
ncbi:hypothetical protein [Periweissella cryptocerci]|uniref:hypothetical protein n=1 Tax=Periweissella cryptocerci TaxID=2506420 RepID=UPI001FAAFDBB|nr:hypothetical protein [Periweissella cryptocerci]